MGRYVPEGTMEVAFVATVALPAAPTSTELEAGVDLTSFMVGDLDLPFEGSTAEAGDLSSKFNKTAPGDYGGQEGSATFHKDSVFASDTAWATLPRDTEGYLAVAPRGLATPGTWAVDDYVDLWPVTVLSRSLNAQARNTTTRFTVKFAITDEPLEDYKLLT
jgi:hypothetical protein